MRKAAFLVIATIILAAAQANAKTQGNYLGVTLLKSTAKIQTASNYDLHNNDPESQPFYVNKKRGSNYGYGFSYKHAFNFDGFFIAPGASYEVLNNITRAGHSVASNNHFSQHLKIKDSITLRTDLGYDLNDKFAVYVPFGVSHFSYSSKTSDMLPNQYIGNKKTGGKNGIFAGFGASYEPIKNWVVNLEYNKYRNIKFVSADPATLDNTLIITKTKIEIFKLGLAYRF